MKIYFQAVSLSLPLSLSLSLPPPLLFFLFHFCSFFLFFLIPAVDFIIWEISVLQTMRYCRINLKTDSYRVISMTAVTQYDMCSY